MALIRCKACGKLYSYEKEGCCPGCGAYNRPPKRERVNPDGTVQHMTDAEYTRRKKATGKVCFEEKECYEEKVCYEDQARKGARKSQPHADRKEKPHTHAAARENPAAQTLRQMAARTGSRQKSGNRSLLGIIISVIIAISISSGVLGSIVDRISHNDPVPVVDPADSYSYDVVMGQELVTDDGSRFTVWGWELDDNDKEVTVTMDADFASSGHGFYASLLCTDEDGDEITLDYKDSKATDNGLKALFDSYDYSDLKPFCLILDEYDGDDDLVNTWWIDLR